MKIIATNADSFVQYEMMLKNHSNRIRNLSYERDHDIKQHRQP